jgi:protein N-terminal methyltransferase
MNKRQPHGDEAEARDAEPRNTHVELDKSTTPKDPGAESIPDTRIDATAAISYWSRLPATDASVLGGHPQISSADLRGSFLFLAKLLRQTPTTPGDEARPQRRFVDCGAGIGRVTRGVLCKLASTVDIVEPVKAFTDQIKEETYVGTIFNVGLEQWNIDELGIYNVVWNQWCLCQLTDTQVVDYLIRVQTALAPNGWIVVKENLLRPEAEEDAYDSTDNTITRTDRKFRSIFNQARLEVVYSELQRGMPRGLYRIMMYALQPSTRMEETAARRSSKRIKVAQLATQ